MLGLCKGLAVAARLHSPNPFPGTLADIWDAYPYADRKCILASPYACFPAHRLYFALLDACPFSMS